MQGGVRPHRPIPTDPGTHKHRRIAAAEPAAVPAPSAAPVRLPPLPRRLLDPLTLLSLLLCVALCALWVRSYQVSQFVGWSDASRFVGALSMGGLVRLEHGTYPGESQGWSRVSYPTPAGPGLWAEAGARDRRGGWLKRLGFAYVRFTYDAAGRQVRRALYVPHALPAGLAALAPLVRLRRHLRAKRRRVEGRCRSCDYDLTGNVSSVCPECGTARPQRS